MKKIFFKLFTFLKSASICFFFLGSAPFQKGFVTECAENMHKLCDFTHKWLSRIEYKRFSLRKKHDIPIIHRKIKFERKSLLKIRGRGAKPPGKKLYIHEYNNMKLPTNEKYVVSGSSFWRGGYLKTFSQKASFEGGGYF